MTAKTRNSLIAVIGVLVSSPALATLLDFSPMGYHAGTALVVRVVAVFLATSLLAVVFGIAGYLYWSNVIAPAPAPMLARVDRRNHRG